jgi:hypothetical protein
MNRTIFPNGLGTTLALDLARHMKKSKPTQPQHFKSMKRNSVILGISLFIALAVVGGCKKEEPVAATPAPMPSAPTSSDAPRGTDVAKDAVQQAPDKATTPAVTSANAAEQQAQGLIDKAKSYVADQKYQDALTSLSQLSASKLTPDQQKLVDGLKAQIQSAMAKASTSDAASALGGALGGKK